MELDLTATVINFEEWLKTRDLREGSVYMYVSAVKKFLFEASRKELAIDKIDTYNDFIFEHSIKKRSNYMYDALKLFIKHYYEKDGKTSGALIRALIKPKVVDPKKHIHYLDDDTREQVIKLIKDYKHRIMARVQNYTGVRAGDILRLKRGTISYEAYQDKVVVMRIDFEGKGGRNFIKWIFDPKVQMEIDLFLKGNLIDTEYYFLERRTSRYYAPTFYNHVYNNYQRYLKDLKQALDFYGIEYKQWATHDFRRAFARNVWNQTRDPIVLKEMLNHAQFDTTLRYLRGSGLQSKDVYFQLFQKREAENR